MSLPGHVLIKQEKHVKSESTLERQLMHRCIIHYILNIIVTFIVTEVKSDVEFESHRSALLCHRFSGLKNLIQTTTPNKSIHIQIQWLSVT